MSTQPEPRTVAAVELLRTLPDWSRSAKVNWLLANTDVSRSTAYRITAQEQRHDLRQSKPD